MKKQIKKEIDLNKKYIFPNDLVVVRYNSKIIIIAINIGNWIVLENERQLKIFNLLKDNSIAKAFSIFNDYKEDVIHTIIQIEARQFERNSVVNKSRTNNIMFYLTNACNLRCPHCYMHSDYKKENEININEIIKFLSELTNFNISKVTFSGGEVCMRDDLVEIIDSTYNLNFKIKILSNGTLWNDKLIEKVASKISEIQISIDGYSEEENAKVRGKGNFYKALDTVDKFVNLGVKTRIAITPLFDKNLENKIHNYINFSNQLLEKYKGKKFDISFSRKLIRENKLIFNDFEDQKYFEIIDKIYNEINTISNRLAFIERHKNFEVFDNCSFGNLYISSIGDVYACSVISKLKPFANIKNGNFSKIIKMAKKAKAISNVNNLEPCNRCELKYICGGGCRIIHFNQIVQADNFELENIPQRICTKSEKEFFYKLMIKSNKEIFQ